MLTEADKQVWNWRENTGPLPQAMVDEFLATCSPEERAYFLRRVDEKGTDIDYFAARWHYLQKSRQQAERLGLQPHPEFWHPTLQASGIDEPHVIVAFVQGDQAGRELAEQWGFSFLPANAMRETLDSRRDQDALIGFLGDDRDNTYWVAVAWAPMEYQYMSALTGITEFNRPN